MENLYLKPESAAALIVIASIAVIAALLSLKKLYDVKNRLQHVSGVLDDIAAGNPNNKVLASPKDLTANICYQLNDIVSLYQQQIITLKQSAEANQQLMTSLSHDVRTPLTTLIGYLDAAHKDIVVGLEREQYIETARLRAHDLKEYVDQLFEWFKLNSSEETLVTENVEVAELTRSTLMDWVPVFENSGLEYDIDTPEGPLWVHLDSGAYSRILNNLVQNVLMHSEATHITISVVQQNSTMLLLVGDNGKGIAGRDLPYIFERLYKCDKSRARKGSGLGLSIALQLVTRLGGTIAVQSDPNLETKFFVQFPLI
ncbi:HAMP domain-containing histidine kinase [Paenibacillus albidus]|uniref:sensor histidine kinase n=1 Tax=Paenibacillus albidus TaxID=2041023 RepID=UPI001BE8D9A2|nr:HAMP domain-containing sensor histidine kinase [Paenibacillus albidus]MBT2292762.1 HAMP domain-containing histidine kinase [Paenibacillus albidus]